MGNIKICQKWIASMALHQACTTQEARRAKLST